ncbi:DUF4810 domain-containing protein [Zoogloea sp.]|uniref:DUF4810 domain-containing protein n=1 Tax=Zoogloea sp. TaxID=49181 RepID=UPI0031FD74E9
MKRPPLSRIHLACGLSMAAALLATGCANRPKPLYHWGDYQAQVYGHLTRSASPDEQIAKLEGGLEEARASGRNVPPGYLAHLGILHAQLEHPDQMLKYFEAEKALYPESAAYIDFLLRKYPRTQ